MSETPEIIAAEIAVLQTRLAEAEAVVAPVESGVESALAPIVVPAAAEIIADIIEDVQARTAPVADVPVTHGHHIIRPAGQTIPAAWALQPLAR